jgi:putative zinc finger/helix-turn-helix YgiT family protein
MARPVALDYRTQIEHDGRSYTVDIPNLAVVKCEKCGAVVLDDAANQRITDALRTAAGLLRPEQIREARKRLGLTQKELAASLDISEFTVSRWETGDQIQQKAMNRMLKAFFNCPQTRAYMAREADSQRAGEAEVGVSSRGLTPTEDAPRQSCPAVDAKPFEVGRAYSRREISDALGGSLRTYLPVVDGRVVCGCFKRIPEKNPHAPEKVTIGNASRPEPLLVSRQVDPIPVFLFRSSGAWEYQGRYRCTGFSTEPKLLEQEMAANPARGVIAGVLYFERVGD